MLVISPYNLRKNVKRNSKSPKDRTLFLHAY